MKAIGDKLKNKKVLITGGLGMIGTTIVPVRYVTLPVPDDEQLGYQLMISFWAWGSSEAELMTSLGRVMKNLSHGLRAHRRIRAG